MGRRSQSSEAEESRARQSEAKLRTAIERGREMRPREDALKISRLAALLRYFDVHLSGRADAYEYDDVTARKLAPAKYTSDSCAWFPRACMLRAYYAKLVLRASKGVSPLRESRARTRVP